MGPDIRRAFTDTSPGEETDKVQVSEGHDAGGKLHHPDHPPHFGNRQESSRDLQKAHDKGSSAAHL